PAGGRPGNRPGGDRRRRAGLGLGDGTRRRLPQRPQLAAGIDGRYRGPDPSPGGGRQAQHALHLLQQRPGAAPHRRRPEEGAAAGRGRPAGQGAGRGMKALLTHEIGSLDKPGWRVKAFAGQPLSEADYEEARRWGERLQVPDHPQLVELLRQGPLNREQKLKVQRWSSHYAVRLLESAGLDVVYDGEQQRTEMYDWTVKHSLG